MTRTPTTVATRPLMLIAACAATLALAGCQAGSAAQTSQSYNPTDGRNVNIPADNEFDEPYIAVRNALVVSDGNAASITVTLVNHTDTADVLTEAKVNDAVATFAGGPFEIAPGDKLAIGGGGTAVALADEAGVAPGEWTELSLTFDGAGVTTIDVLAISPDDEYAVLGENA